MAVYPEGSLNAELVRRYREVLARNGTDLKLAPSAGAVESLAQLRDPKSPTSIALVPGGLTTEQDSPDLVSLGTLFYHPFGCFPAIMLCKDIRKARPFAYRSDRSG